MSHYQVLHEIYGHYPKRINFKIIQLSLIIFVIFLLKKTRQAFENLTGLIFKNSPLFADSFKLTSQLQLIGKLEYFQSIDLTG